MFLQNARDMVLVAGVPLRLNEQDARQQDARLRSFEEGKTSPSPTSTTASAELSPLYRAYVIYECLLINLLGFVTLFFQCELQRLESAFLKRFPHALSKEAADTLFGHFWLKDDLNCNSDAARCLTYMVCGWLLIAGILQAFVNFDGLRRRFFKSDWECPRGMKICCLYAFFACDWYWVVLMIAFRGVIGWQQIVGSAVDILLRLVFVTDTSRMFNK